MAGLYPTGVKMKVLEILNESFDQGVADLQTALKAAGASLGPYGPKGDGIDGIMGPYTRRAIKKFPDVASKFKDVVSKPDASDARQIDTSALRDPDFNKKLTKVADALGIQEGDLRAIIKNESNFKPTAQDPNHVSVGLIGFTGPTAARLGTSKDELLNMSAVDQLDYVYKFYKMVGVKPGMDRGTIYMLTFLPAFARAPDSTVIGQNGGGPLILPSGKSSKLTLNIIWQQNPMFGKSRHKDSFTVGDVKNIINSR